MSFESWYANKYPVIVDEQTFELLKDAWNTALEEEREACAKVCDNYPIPERVEGAHPDYLDGKRMALSQVAHEIRARTNKEI